MRHDLAIDGLAFRLRPVELADAAEIVRLRTSERNGRYINATSPSVSDQEAWMERYFERSGDWYFAVERRSSGALEGLISLYDHHSEENTAEWGRWIMVEGSLGSVESAWLIYRLAFETLALNAAYCRTVADNTAVVSFHDSSGAERVMVHQGSVVLGGIARDQVEHRVTRLLWPTVDTKLKGLTQRIAQRLNRTDGKT